MDMRIFTPGFPPTMPHLTPSTPKDLSQTTANTRPATQCLAPSTTKDSFRLTFPKEPARLHADSALASSSAIPADTPPGPHR